jgi:hypothetical protein
MHRLANTGFIDIYFVQMLNMFLGSTILIKCNKIGGNRRQCITMEIEHLSDKKLARELFKMGVINVFKLRLDDFVTMSKLG